MKGEGARAVLAAAAVAVAGGAVLWWGSDGGRALTSETVRRLDVAAAPRTLPATTLYDQTGGPLTLADYRGHPVVLEFVYATCPDICLALGDAFERLDAELPPAVGLLSISFDPADDPERLGWFAARYPESPRWRVAGVPDASERAALLDAAEVIVLPDGEGGFVHNAGLYVVDADGRLVAIFDPEDGAGVLAALAGGAGS